MYAVIRTGGKQYRVAPGDVISIEKTAAENGKVEFTDILAVGGNDGKVEKPSGATVTGEVVSEERGGKILVFHFKRKKQYKKLLGHRQQQTTVRIAEISFDGQKFKAEDVKAYATRNTGTEKAEAAPKATGPRAQRAGAATATSEKRAAAPKAAKKSAAKKTAKKK